MNIYKLSLISNEIVSRCKEHNLDYYDFIIAIVFKRFDDLLGSVEEINIDRLGISEQVFKELLKVDEQITDSFFLNRLNNQYNFYRIIYDNTFYYSSNIMALVHQLVMIKFSSDDKDSIGVLSDFFGNRDIPNFYNHNEKVSFWDSLIQRFRKINNDFFYQISFKEFTSLEFVYLLINLINSRCLHKTYYDREETFQLLLSYFLIEKNNPTNQEINEVYQISQIEFSNLSLFESVKEINEDSIISISQYQPSFNILNDEYNFCVKTSKYFLSIFKNIKSENSNEEKYLSLAFDCIFISFYNGLKDFDFFPLDIHEVIYENIVNSEDYYSAEILSFYLSTPLIYIQDIEKTDFEEFQKLINKVISNLLNFINKYVEQINAFFKYQYLNDEIFKKEFCKRFGYEYPLEEDEEDEEGYLNDEFEKFENFVFEVFSQKF